MAGGSLSDLIKKFGNSLPEHTIASYTRQILRGLRYLHRNNIIHRDIKGANILVGTEGRVKLADFGCSRRFGEHSRIKTMQGTPCWMAPEVIKQLGCGRAADIWSLGCTVVEMASSKPPWSECTNVCAALYKISSTDELPEIPPSLSDTAVSFVTLCFVRYYLLLEAIFYVDDIKIISILYVKIGSRNLGQQPLNC